MLYFKIDILTALKKAGYNQTVLTRQGIISGANLQKLRRGTVPGGIVLDRLCELLQKQPGALIAWKQDQDQDRGKM